MLKARLKYKVKLLNVGFAQLNVDLLVGILWSGLYSRGPPLLVSNRYANNNRPIVKKVVEQIMMEEEIVGLIIM